MIDITNRCNKKWYSICAAVEKIFYDKSTSCMSNFELNIFQVSQVDSKQNSSVYSV